MEEKNNYTEILSSRLKEARLGKNMTIEELAREIDVQRQTLNYVELNKKGRSLTISNLIKVADVLGVSIDYLLGRVKSKNGILNSYNIEEWGNNTLGSFDKFMDEIKEQNLSYDLNAYIFVNYVTKNVMKEIFEKIKGKVESKEELNKAEVRKLEFLSAYTQYIKCQKTENYSYLRFLVNEKWSDHYDTIIEECANLSNYNRDKKIKIEFNVISSFQEMLEEFEEYLSHKIDKELKTVKEDVVNKIVKDNRYFYRILRYFNEAE